MELLTVLSPDLMNVELRGETKEEIIEELLDLLMKSGKILDREKALQSLLEREERMSTGIQDGVAIPHAKTDAVTEMVACVGLKPGGMDFQSLDGRPSQIFIMTLSPTSGSGPHVRFLASVSRLLQDEEAREALLGSSEPEELYRRMVR